MMFQVFKIALLTSILLATPNIPYSTKEEYNLEVKLENIIVNKGEIYIALYDSEANFLVIPRQKLNRKVNNRSQKILFLNLPRGNYSVMIFQDLNRNKKLDKFMSLPTEPYGASNNPTGYPTFNNSKISLNNNQTIHINIKN
jgi:uncharacterized protein (DUF2141 family)